jgi:hypothetical protein
MDANTHTACITLLELVRLKRRTAPFILKQLLERLYFRCVVLVPILCRMTLVHMNEILP